MNLASLMHSCVRGFRKAEIHAAPLEDRKRIQQQSKMMVHESWELAESFRYDLL